MASRNRRRVARAERMSRARSRLRSLGVAVARLLGALLVTSALVAAMVGAHAWFTTDETFAVRQVEVFGASLASKEELVARSGITAGTNIFSIDLSAAARLVEQDSWVIRASLARELPDIIHVLVEEHRPRALVALESLYAVDGQGVIFKRVRSGDRIDLPIITGLAREAFVGDKRQDVELRTALMIVERWEASRFGAERELSEVNVSEESGAPAYVAWLSEPPVELRLGAVDAGDMATVDAALERLGRVWSEIEARGVRAAMIDLGNRQRVDWVPVKLQ